MASLSQSQCMKLSSISPAFKSNPTFPRPAHSNYAFKLKFNHKLAVKPVRVSYEVAGAEIKDRKEEEEEEEGRKLRVGLICGGPSAERGISLNSARSVLDHIQGEDLIVSCYYVDPDLNAYAVSPAQLYSNTPADFDFKLESLAQGFESLNEFTNHLSQSVDIVFPVIHGRFGEDGGIQELLEKANIPFVGTSCQQCKRAFDKYNASIELKNLGFPTIPSFLIDQTKTNKQQLIQWFQNNNLNPQNGKVIVKPTKSGSSIGVRTAFGAEDSIKKALEIISSKIDDNALVEIFLEGGKEFTAIVLHVGPVSDRQPVVLLPTEIELLNENNNENNEGENGIFDYRKKYLPSQQVKYYTPPGFEEEVTECIREGAKRVFEGLNLKDFARIDGWFLPAGKKEKVEGQNGNFAFGRTEFGTVVFTDINLISGMEQTSFLFQQASKVGFSHSGILRTVIQNAVSRFPSLTPATQKWNSFSQKLRRKKSVKNNGGKKKKVFVLFGGDTSERQVSLMSGTNVWLNLQSFHDLDVVPCLLAPMDGYSSSLNQNIDEFDKSWAVWTLPYSLVLRHTTEEVHDACTEAIDPDRAVLTTKLRAKVVSELKEHLMKVEWFNGFDFEEIPPVKYSLEEWIQLAKDSGATVFIAVHGGIGEDGTLQLMLESEEIPYTGPGPAASRTCIDKVKTSETLRKLVDKGVLTIPKDVWSVENILKNEIKLETIWDDLITMFRSQTICVKPARDGCSTGVARLCSVEDLKVYLNALRNLSPRILPNSLSRAHGVIEMAVPPPKQLIFEPFIETDDVSIASGSAHDLAFSGKSEWVEVTAGVFGRNGDMRCFNPSVTVKETGDVLSLEEKFQGGTGINLTPPPEEIISEEALKKCKERMELIANTLGLEGFSRIDAFVNVETGEVLVIEVNTVPGMTPSTVLIHQALAEEPPIYPQEFFRKIVDQALMRTKYISPFSFR
ncbi:hypothetical protein LUZ60_013109 [Juncus effusus]|nr:hypothetical protein LUZ60_013109 [Juncus effusus]